MRRLFPVTEETAARTPEATGGADAAEVPTAGGGESPAAAGTPDAKDARPPAGGRSDVVEREWSLDELAAAYAYPEPAPGGREPWLRANMVSTLDGAAQHGGRSQPISSDADMRIFGTLRGLADVVIVGAETVRQEGYRPA
ncbi:dihydrofolate reductase family protein, partial [Streptomyces caniscabiei]